MTKATDRKSSTRATGKRRPSHTTEATTEPSSQKAPEGEARAVRKRTPILRRAVLDTAAEIFAQRGFAGTNLRDIADALGMSRPGLYYHFPSKESLLEALVEEVTIAAELRETELAAEHVDDPIAALRAAVDFGTKWVIDHSRLFRVVERSEAELPADLLERSDNSKRAILANLVAIIDRGIEQGLFRPIDSHVAALTVLGMQNWASWWFKPEGRRTAVDVSRQIADMAVESVIRSDVHRTRTGKVGDVLRVLEEDVAHLKRLLRDQEG